MINSLLAQSEYIAIRTGVFSLATPAFGAVGGFASAGLLLHDHVPVVVSVLAAVGCSGIAGLALALPLSRLRGVFQGIATLGIVIIVQNLAYLWTGFTGGAPGLQGIPRWAGLAPIAWIFVVTVYLVARVDRSVIGHKMTAIRVDELVAAANGINVFRYQLAALVVSGALGGLGGALLAGNQYAIDPSVFGFSLILQTVAAVFLGGLGLWVGPIIGAAILVAIPQFLSSLAVYEPAVAGVMLIAVLVLLPGGVWSLVRGAVSLGARQVRRVRPHGAAKEVDLVGAVAPGIVAAMPSVATSLPSGREIKATRSPAALRTRAPELVVKQHSTKVETSSGQLGRSEDSVLVVDSVSRSFAGVRAVSDVSCAVSSGETLGLIGPNGAGKSTLVNLICGNLLLDEGTITVNGQRIDQWPAAKISRLGVRRTFQTCRVLSAETVLQNVSVGFGIHAAREIARSALLLGRSGGAGARDRRAMEALSLCGLADRSDELAGALPYAAQRRLEIARALAPGGCRILLLDEPAAGMTDAECDELQELIERITRELNIGVLLIEHHVEFVFSTCDRVIVTNSGSTIAEGSPEEVRASEVVLDAYLGKRYA